MPFDEPWRDFVPGDLVYGIEKSTYGGRDRDKYVHKWKANENPPDTPPARIDEYRILRRELGREPEKPEQAWEASMKKTLQQHPRYKNAVDGSGSSPAETNCIVRRKDKGGLYWATLVAGKHVHFVLDGLDMLAVIRKSFTKNSLAPYQKRGGIGNVQGGPNLQFDTPVGTPAEEKVRSITGAELRWVYRHREHPNIQAFIQFWHEGEQCVPPWLHWTHIDAKSVQESEIHQLWAHYQPRRTLQVHHDPVDIPVRPSMASQAAIGGDGGGGRQGEKQGCGCTVS